MISRLLPALLLLPAAAFAAALPIEFNGVVVEGSKIQVSLLNPNTGSAKWVTVGGKFDNYIVTSCNVLAVTSSGQSIQNPTVILTNAVTKVEMPILIKSSQILSAPSAGQIFNNGQNGMVTTTTVTMGPNGPVVSTGPGGPNGPGGPGGQVVQGTVNVQGPAPTPPPAAPAPPAPGP